jgi:TusA-related sulfurtransferase
MAEAPPTQDLTLDTKGLLCPMPIVKLAKAIREMEPQQVVLLEATDPGSIPDVTAWAKNTGNPLLHHETDGKVMRFWIQKA